MITIDNIADYFVSAGLIGSTNIYNGKADLTKEQVIGLYNKVTSENELSVGGISNTTYEQKAFTVLVHWDESFATSEQKAIDIYEHFRANQEITIGGKSVFQVRCLSGQPIYVDVDQNNVHEFVLDFLIEYNRI